MKQSILASEQASEPASLVTASATNTESIAIVPDSPPQASATVSEADSDSFSGSTLTLCPGRPKSPTSSVVSPVVKLTPKRRLSAAKVETFSSGKSTLSLQAERPNPPSSSAGSPGDIVTSSSWSHWSVGQCSPSKIFLSEAIHDEIATKLQSLGRPAHCLS